VPIERAQYIYSLGKKTISEITIRNLECTVSFVRNSGGQWEMRLPAPYRADAQKLAIIEKFLTELPMKRVLRTGKAGSSAYGLDNPEISVDFRTSDGSARTLLIGGLTSSKAQRYVRDPSRPYVFLVDIGYVSQFEGTVSSYRVKTIFDIDLDSLSGIGLFKAGKPVVSLVLAADAWRISQPFSAAANPVEVNKLLVNLRNLKAIAYVEEQAPNLSKLGFAPPSFSLALRDAHGGRQTLDFGATDESGFLYMRRGGGTDIVKLLASDLDFRSFEPDMLLGEAPFKESINNVRRLIVKDRGTTTEFAVDSISQPPSYTYRNRQLDEGTFITFYVKCINLVAVGYQPWTPVGEPDVTLTSDLKDGSKKILELYPRDSKTYFLRPNGGGVLFFTDAKQVDLVRSWMKKLTQAK
jgi:hypothetical protein